MRWLKWILVLLPVVAYAEVDSIKTEITRTLQVADDRFGGCMVALKTSPAEEGVLDCPPRKWVTFSCIGEHTNKFRAQRMFETAQVAFISGHRVEVWVDDARKHNGYCLVSRIDILSAKVEESKSTSASSPADPYLLSPGE